MIRMFRPYVSERAIPAVAEVLRSGWIGEGPQVARFEAALREKFGWQHVVALNSGTAGLRLALAIAGVGPGDDVLTTPNTCTATNMAILEQYARPVFVDIQHSTGNMDPGDILRKMTSRTKAILCVHWAGYPCDLQEINGIALAHGIPVIEDAAHALGASYHGIPIGKYSRFTMFSLQAIKVLTTGDGGLLVCQGEDDHHAARRRRWFGIDRRNRRVRQADGYPYWSQVEPGYKAHMNDIAAVIGLANLEDVDRLIQERARQAEVYRAELAGVPGVTLFECASDRVSGNWLFTMHVENRSAFRQTMLDRGVETSVVHIRNDQFPVFGGLRDDLPVMDKYEQTHISIPIGWHVTPEDQARVIEAIKNGW